MDLKGKIVVITGSTGGIGREIVKRLDSESVTLILVSKTESELQTQLKSLNNKNSVWYVADLSNQIDTAKIASEISKKYEKVDILINAAGIGIYKPFEELSLEEWNRSLNINLNASFIMIKELMGSLNNSSESIILSLGSGMGVSPEPQRSAYCTSKFALRGLMLTLAEEYKRFKKPEFCLLTLGSVLTSFGPMSFEEKKRDMESGKGYLTPEWVSEKIVELLKSETREVEYEFSSPDYNKS